MNPPSRKGQDSAAYSTRCDEVKEVITRMNEDQLWDSTNARDLDPRLIDHVCEQIESGVSPGEIARNLNLPGGKNSRQWKKIAAYFRQGFRADAEAYLMQQTHKHYKNLDRLREVFEDALENGVPIVIPATKETSTEVIRVKGATKELAGFAKAYGEAVSLPVKLWKDFGAIGEKKDVGMGGTTIVVQNNIPMPSVEEIMAHQDEMEARAKAIEVKSGSKP